MNTNMELIAKLIKDRKDYYDYMKMDMHTRMTEKVLTQSKKLQKEYTVDEQYRLFGMQEMLFFVYELLDNYGELQ